MSTFAINIDRTKVALFVRTEVATVSDPNNPARIHTFRHIDELTDLLLAVLDLGVAERELERLDSRVLTALGAFLDGNNRETLAQALETLAAAFESFLKKLGAVRYRGDTVRLHGDGTQYAGLMKTTLGALLEGKVAKLDPRNARVPALSAPIVTFSYGGSRIQDAVYERTRSLRNDVHVSRDRTIIQTLADFKCVMAAYLFAVEENIIILRTVADPLFQYLNRVKENFRTWELKYVELLGQSRAEAPTTWTELQALEWRDESEQTIDQNISMESVAAGAQFPAPPAPASKPTTVAKIASSHPRFCLLGEPGAGKSTSLQRLALERASELLITGYFVKPLPVFVRLRELSSANPLEGVIAALIGVSIDEVDPLLARGMLWLLLDGLNEVPRAESADFTRMLRQFLIKHNCPVIISSRRLGFQKTIGLPVFELLCESDRGTWKLFDQ